MPELLPFSPEEITERFYALQTSQDVARLLNVQHGQLVYYLYQVKPEQNYRRFTVPKSAGGVRQIYAPGPRLKWIQRKLNQVLNTVYQPREAAHGFVIQRSILTNAQTHASRHPNWVLNIDLLDFFPSIHFGRVRGLFISPPYSLNDQVATVLAQICCYDNQLPQGAPTSPVVSNMICARMDHELLGFAFEQGCLYTRYADDLTFSTVAKELPKQVAVQRPDGSVHAGEGIQEILHQNDFQINPSKVRLRHRTQRQEITGLTINQFPNVSRAYIRQVRAMLHAWERRGYRAAEQAYLTRHMDGAKGTEEKPPPFWKVVRGKIEFLGMVRGKQDKIYQRFLATYLALNRTRQKK